MADRSVRSCHAVCQMALDKAVEEKLIHGNPAAGCRLPPIKGREMQVLTQEEMRRFLIQAKAGGNVRAVPAGSDHRDAPGVNCWPFGGMIWTSPRGSFALTSRSVRWAGS